jgi:chemotaxis family two-component system response regulator Rcp1
MVNTQVFTPYLRHFDLAIYLVYPNLYLWTVSSRSMNAFRKAIEILLVEDNPGDIRLTQEALKEGAVKKNLRVVRDGAEAMDFLCREGKHAEAPRPDVIILDLNLPKKNGREVLAELKQDPRLRSIPIVVLTSSRAQEDICKAYHLQANCYITKPGNLDDFFKAVRTIEHFWLTLAKLPPSAGTVSLSC